MVILMTVLLAKQHAHWTQKSFVDSAYASALWPRPELDSPRDKLQGQMLLGPAPEVALALPSSAGYLSKIGSLKIASEERNPLSRTQVPQVGPKIFCELAI